MTWRRIVAVTAGAGVVSLAISQPLDDEQRLSVRLWLAFTAAALIGVLLLHLVTHLPVAATQTDFRLPRRWWRRWRRRREVDPTSIAAELRAAAGLIARATENVRTHKGQLRPRLTELADHVVPRRASTPQDRLRELIAAAGDTGWLIDPAIEDRTPTIDEIDRFLDRVLDVDQPAKTRPQP